MNLKDVVGVISYTRDLRTLHSAQLGNQMCQLLSSVGSGKAQPTACESFLSPVQLVHASTIIHVGTRLLPRASSSRPYKDVQQQQTSVTRMAYCDTHQLCCDVHNAAPPMQGHKRCRSLILDPSLISGQPRVQMQRSKEACLQHGIDNHACASQKCRCPTAAPP